MKSILLSVQPKWVEKIVSREKDIEVRTKMPNCDLPIDVFIYCTDNLKQYNKESLATKHYFSNLYLGKVVAKFTLNKVEEICISSNDVIKHPVVEFDKFKDILKKSCLSERECRDYIYGKGSKEFDIGYAWHIDNLVIFDKVKELKEFYKLCKYSNSYDLCNDCCGYAENSQCKNGLIPISKAPQSYCYVEVEE